MFDAVAAAAAERWPPEVELAAASLEVAHAQLLAFLRVYSKPGTRLPEPLKVERPGQPPPPLARETGGERVSLAELAALPGLTADLRGAAD